MFRSGLTFVFSHIEVDGQLPVPLIQDHIFRKATDQEAEILQENLNRFALDFRAWTSIVPYRYSVRAEQDVQYPGRTSFFHEALPCEKWKYWVIAHECSNVHIRDLEHAAILLPVDLDFGFTLIYDEGLQRGSVVGRTGMPIHLVEIYNGPGFHMTQPARVQTADIARIKEYYELALSLPESGSFMRDAMRNFYGVRSISGGSTLRAIGYFAIIEALVTHSPRLAESLDSITHQIVNKLMLVAKRFERPFRAASSFPSVSEEKVWKKLYEYRSCLAHGGKPDFNKEFQILKSEQEVIAFLKETVKLLILFGLKNHELLADLKKC
jgi:hypothetical protein